jgi:acyl carrier protein
MAEYQLSEIAHGVKEVILESLELEDKDFSLSTSVMDELGAESLDFLDIVFRLEKKYRVKIERGRMERQLRERFPDMQIKQNTEITPELAEQLKQMLPEVAPERIESLRKIKELSGTFTIASFVRLTIQSLYESDPATVIHCNHPAFQPLQLGVQPT